MSLDEAAHLLRDYLREVGFVRLHKYLVGPARYHANPTLLGPEPAQAVRSVASGADGELALAFCLLADVPLELAALTPARRALADALLAAGLLEQRGDTLRLGGLQLSSFQGAPLFIDRRLGRGDASHEVYLGPDSALLTYYIDSESIGRADAVLDLGTGSGALALYLARFSQRVVATDVMPAPLWLADLNRRLNGCADTLELRRESYIDTLARGERYRAVVCNPPFLPVPDGLAAPAYAAGPGRDGLDHCRMLIELFDSVVAPGGTAYLVAALPGDARQPYFFAELTRYAAALGLAVDVFVDGCIDLDADPEPLARHARHLVQRNLGLAPEEALRRVEQLFRSDLGADHLYLGSMVVRHVQGGRAALFDRRAVR